MTATPVTRTSASAVTRVLRQSGYTTDFTSHQYYYGPSDSRTVLFTNHKYGQRLQDALEALGYVVERQHGFLTVLGKTAR